MFNLARETATEENSDLAPHEQQERLQALIRAAAKSAPRFPDFIDQLAKQQVSLVCKLTRKGRVSSIHYVFQSDFEIKASALGDAFTWTGLQRKLGVEYVQIRDFKLLSSLAKSADPASTRSKTTLNEQALLARFEQLELLEKQILDKLEHLPSIDLNEVTRTIESMSNDELQRVDEAVLRLETVLDSIQVDIDERAGRTPSEDLGQSGISPGLEEELRHSLTQIRSLCQRAFSDTNKSLHRVEYASNKMRQESFWLAFVSALIAAFVSALVTGLWMTQEMEKSIESNRQALVQELEKNAAEDPLRIYFQRLMDNMP